MPFAVDTNVYIAAFEDPLSLERFGDFALSHDTLVSSVVVAELLLGPVRSHARRQMIRDLTRAGPALPPTHADWTAAATAVSRLERQSAKSRSFWNDALLAAQCARLGLTLVTSNADDFRRLQRELHVEIATPFPP